MSTSIPQELPRFIHIYCDESRQTSERYMVLGGVIINRDFAPHFQGMFDEYRDVHRMHAELKWKKVSTQKLHEYKALVDLFFEVTAYIHFKSIVIDTTEVDHKRFNHNNKELGFYKLMYQFLLNSFGRYLRPLDNCIIFLDQRNSKYKLSTLCAILNNGLHKKYPNLNHPVRNIQAINSKTSDLVQLADVFMGAVGYQVNHCDQIEGAKRGKIELARYIAEKARVVDFCRDTSYGKRDFSIWHFHFKK